MNFAVNKFKEHVYLDRPHPNHKNGWQVVFKFPNGYGASLIKTRYSYGGDKGLYEMAVIQFDVDGKEFAISYETPITDDVLGYLNEEEVIGTLQKIKELE